METPNDNLLGRFLKDRRAKLNPAALDLPLARRRTPGLRREEVAQRAHVSVTWYTWLEQGRGGAPSAEVLDRLARALSLQGPEREHLYLLAQGRPPGLKHSGLSVNVSPTIQRVLDALETSPTLVKDAAWNIVAWNEAASAVLIDYASLQPEERNVLRLVFCHPRVRAMPDWETTARFVLASFRAEVTRAGASQQTQDLVADLSRSNPEFAAMWQEHAVQNHGEGSKRVQPPAGPPIALEYASFAIDGQAGLSMVVYMPTTPTDVELVKASIQHWRATRAAQAA